MSDLGNKDIFAKNLKYYMDYYEKDRNKICDDLNIPYTTFTDWYNAKTYPRIDKIELLSNYFNIKKSDLIENKYKDINFDNGEIVNISYNTVKIPVLGRIPAGMPFEAIEEQYTTDYEEIPKEWLKGGNEYFALKLDGDSMEPEYQDKDIVIFRKAFDCESGQDCCVRINGFDATFKRIKKQLNGIMIIPLNENNSTGFTTTFYTNDDVMNMPIEVLGVVKQIRRNR